MSAFKWISVLYSVLLFSAAVYGEIILDIDIPDDDEDTDVSRPSAAPERVVDSGGMDILRFGTNDSLRGELLSFDPAHGIVWKSPEAAQEILFNTKNVVSVGIGKYVVYPDRNVIIGLTNGDFLSGSLIALGLSEAKLATEYGGILTVNRSMIKYIYPENETADILFSGVGKIEDWKVDSRSGGDVKLDDGIISISGVGSIGRDMKMGDMARIDFIFEASGNCQFQLMFYAGDQAGSPRNSYWLYVSSGHAYLQRFGPSGSENLGMVQSNEFRAGKGKVSLLADRKNGKFTLLIDDTVSKQWVDPGKLDEAGSHVYFANQTHGTLKISDLKVSIWNGKLPGASNAADSVEDDQIVFINGDQISGKLQTIEDSLAKVKTEYAELSVPLARIRHIQTASSLSHLARRNAGDARFFFPDGRSLTLDLAKISDGKVIGRSENLGEVQIAMNAFKSFDLNIYRDKGD